MSRHIILHELAANNTDRFSPFCWRTRWGLAHKGLSFESSSIPFPRIGELGGQNKTVPAIQVGDTYVEDSWAIAEFLDEHFPERPPLFGCAIGKGTARFVECFTDKVIHPTILKLIAEDVFYRLTPEDQVYFRRTREEMLGTTLELAQQGRDALVQSFRKAIHPIRLTLLKQSWLSGEAPGHADYIVLAAFQWARLASPFQILMDDDPIFEWFQRGLELHDGFGKKYHPSAGGLGFARPTAAREAAEICKTT